MIMHNTRESAIRREEFHQVLQEWLDDSFDEQAGDSDNHAGTAWLWVRHGGEHYYLDATSTRSGVREYLRLVTASKGDVGWRLIDSPSELRERVTVGRATGPIEGFEFYRHLPRR